MKLKIATTLVAAMVTILGGSILNSQAEVVAINQEFIWFEVVMYSTLGWLLAFGGLIWIYDTLWVK